MTIILKIWPLFSKFDRYWFYWSCCPILYNYSYYILTYVQVFRYCVVTVLYISKPSTFNENMAIFSTSISQEIFYEHSNLVKGYMLCFFISHIPISVEVSGFIGFCPIMISSWILLICKCFRLMVLVLSCKLKLQLCKSLRHYHNLYPRATLRFLLCGYNIISFFLSPMDYFS